MPPPPPPPPIISHYTIEETHKKAHSLTRFFLNKTRKLAAFRRPLKCKKHAKHVFIHKARRFPHALRPLFLTLLLTATIGLTHCFSSNGGGGGGGGGGSPVYTCTNGTPSEGSPDGADNVESCASCDADYMLVDGECSCTPGDTVLLLSSTLTIGSCNVGSVITDWGYGTGDCVIGGSLSNDNFEIDGTDYTIRSLYRSIDRTPSPPGNELYFYVGTGGLLVPTGNLVLQLDSDEFAFADASVSSAKHYFWREPGLSWTSGNVTVTLFERITCP